MKPIKRWTITAALVGAALGALATLAGARDERPVADPGRDIGRGERVMLVVAGDFATREEAATATPLLGELTGFFVAPTDDFEGMPPGRWLVLTAFRTQRGADEFIATAAHFGITNLTRIVARYTGEAYIGLGQEPHPDGHGPLVGPLPPDHPDRIR
jgi:hypothetical protein